MTKPKLPTQKDFDKLYNDNGSFSRAIMFWEMSIPSTRLLHPPVFTLKQHEHKGLPSAYQIYMDSVDEYDAATKLAPNMKIWDEMVDSKWFFEGEPKHGHQGLVVWREHKRLKDASMMKKLLIKKAKTGDVTAAKALLLETKTKRPVGRKTKSSEASPSESRVVAFKKRNNNR